MTRRKPRSRTYHKLPPSFASDYIRALRVLSRKHRGDDKDTIKRALRVLRSMDQEAGLAKRGELWIPTPDKRSGYYPIIEKVPYTTVRTMLRKNTSDKLRTKARGIVAASAEPFRPLFARRPGSLNEAQRRSLLAHAIVALPHTRGRYPALLGKRVPGELGMEKTSRSVVPIRSMAPEDWEKGFTMRKFALNEDLQKALKRRMNQKPRLVIPKAKPVQPDIRRVLKDATKTKVQLEPEPSNYITAAEYLCYEDGFRTRLEQIKRGLKRKTRRLWRWVKGDMLPTAARGATLGVASLAQTEVGIGPTTIDLIPVQRAGLDRKFQPHSNMELRTIVKSLQEQLLAETNPIIRRGLEKGLGSVVTELAVRRTLV